VTEPRFTIEIQVAHVTLEAIKTSILTSKTLTDALARGERYAVSVGGQPGDFRVRVRDEITGTLVPIIPRPQRNMIG
jgi:hypothetical protein